MFIIFKTTTSRRMRNRFVIDGLVFL